MITTAAVINSAAERRLHYVDRVWVQRNNRLNKDKKWLKERPEQCGGGGVERKKLSFSLWKTKYETPEEALIGGRNEGRNGTMKKTFESGWKHFERGRQEEEGKLCHFEGLIKFRQRGAACSNYSPLCLTVEALSGTTLPARIREEEDRKRSMER